MGPAEDQVTVHVTEGDSPYHEPAPAWQTQSPMADELNLSLTVPGDAATNLAAWRSDPPEWLSAAGYERKDESYESLVYEAQVMGGGMRALMWGMACTLYRLTATFRDDGAFATRLTLVGQAQDGTREAILAWAERQAAG